MTGQEIVSQLIGHEDSVDDLIASLTESNHETFGEIEVIHEEGDCEGGGDHSEKVFHFKDHNVFIRVTGFYSSYNGTDWENDWTEVSPKEKTITVYE